jgi:hypothetical protein
MHIISAPWCLRTQSRFLYHHQWSAVQSEKVVLMKRGSADQAFSSLRPGRAPARLSVMD